MKLSAILEAGFVDYKREDDAGSQGTDQYSPDGNDPEGSQEVDPNSQDLPPQDDTQPENDPDRQGSIRTVPDAHLVYKRKNENNLYDELWIYKQNQHDTWTMKTYDAIIAGSDIPKGSTSSPDGSQTVEKWEVGAPQDTLVFVNIKGLAN